MGILKDSVVHDTVGVRRYTFGKIERVMKLSRSMADIWAYILSRPRKIFLLVLAGIFVLWIVFGDYGVVARLRMEAEHGMLRARQQQEESKIIENTRKIRQVDDPEAIEKIAREKYNFSRDEEILFIIEKK